MNEWGRLIRIWWQPCSEPESKPRVRLVTIKNGTLDVRWQLEWQAIMKQFVKDTRRRGGKRTWNYFSYLARRPILLGFKGKGTWIIDAIWPEALVGRSTHHPEHCTQPAELTPASGTADPKPTSSRPREGRGLVQDHTANTIHDTAPGSGHGTEGDNAFGVVNTWGWVLDPKWISQGELWCVCGCSWQGRLYLFIYF